MLARNTQAPEKKNEWLSLNVIKKILTLSQEHPLFSTVLLPVFLPEWLPIFSVSLLAIYHPVLLLLSFSSRPQIFIRHESLALARPTATLDTK